MVFRRAGSTALTFGRALAEFSFSHRYLPLPLVARKMPPDFVLLPLALPVAGPLTRLTFAPDLPCF